MPHFDSEFLLHLLVDTTQSVVVISAVDGTILEMKVPHVSRYQGTELIGHKPHEVLDKSTADLWLDVLNKAIETKTPLKREIKFTFKERQLWYDFTIYPLLNEKGELDKFVIIGWDIELKKASELALQKNRTALEEVIDESIAEVKRSYDQLLAEVEERRKIELALQRTQEDYKLIVDNQNDLIARADTNGILHFVSPSCCKFFGKTTEQLIAKSFLTFVHEDDLDATLKAIACLAYPPYHCYLEQRAMTHAGYRWIAWVYSAVLNKKNRVTSIIGVGRDITERKIAEEALNASRKQFQSLVETVNDWIWEVDVESITTYSSPRSRDLLGYDPDELVGRPRYDFSEPAIKESANSFFRNFADASLPFAGIKSNFVHKNGKIVLLESSASPLFSSDNVLIGYQGVSRDITERQNFEQALRKSEQKLSGHLQQTPLGFIEWDINKEVLDWNPAATRIFGYSRNEAIREEIFSKIVPSELHQLLEKIWHDILNGINVHVINQNIRKDGTRIYCEWFNTLVRNENNQPIAISSLVSDVTERRRLEMERKFFEELMEETNDIISIASASKRKIMFMNKAGRDIFGWPDNYELIGSSVNECHPKQILELMEKEWLPIVAKNGVWKGDSSVLAKDGREIPAEQIIKSHKNPEGEVEFYSTILSLKI